MSPDLTDDKSTLVQVMAWCCQAIIIPPHNEVVGRVYWFHSVRPSVCPSVRPASRVRSVTPTVLVGSISSLHILSSNFRRCVACKVSCKIWIFGNFFKFVTLTLSCFHLDLMWIPSVGNHGAAEGISERRRSSCSSWSRSTVRSLI